MEKHSPAEEKAKPVMSYGRPGQVRNGRSPASILGTAMSRTVIWVLPQNSIAPR